VSDQAQDFRFAFGERAQFGGSRAGSGAAYVLVDQAAGERRREERLAGGDESHGLDKAGRRGALEQEAAGAGLERGVNGASAEGSTLRVPARRVHLPQRYTCAIPRSSQ
jgi:hypothetical protein